MNGSILKIENLRKAFGGVVALDDVNAEVEKGSIASIIGPNGAGKTTIFNIITGYLKPTAGAILFEMDDITGEKPHIIASHGVARTFQNVQVFANMSVLENVMVGRHIRSKSGFFTSTLIPPVFRSEEKIIRKEAQKWLSFVNLESESDKSAGSLPLGNQRILEIARALSMEPKLLLLDEPASGLNARETLKMGDLIDKIKEMGITVILVEHDMELVMDISDKVTVINFGRTITSGTPAEVQANPDVIAAYLGE